MCKRLWFLVPILLIAGCGAPKPSGSEADADAEIRRLAEAGAKVIDVRTPQEFQETRVEGAINLPLNELEQRIAQVAPEKGAPLLVHCRTGRRSAQAAAFLEQLGYTNVHDLGSLDRARDLVNH